MGFEGPTAAEKGSTGLGRAVKMVVRTFLEKRHYSIVHRMLSKYWESCHSLTAVMRLMEAHGVHVKPEEEQRLLKLPEELMIDSLVGRMPQQNREQFEHFFLQLSLIVSTTTRLRQAIESGDRATAEEVLDSADNVGIIQYILKMSVVHAGTHVQGLEADHAAWLAETDAKMGRLVKGQEDSVVLKKALAQAEGMLHSVRTSANEKSKSVLMNLAAGDAQAKFHGVFAAWADHTKRMKLEEEVRKEYEEEIERVEKALLDYKAKNVESVKGVLGRKAAATEAQLIVICFNAFKEEVEEKKSKAALADEVAALEAKLKGAADASTANTKKVLARMSADNDAGLVHLVFDAWLQFRKDYLANFEMEEALKAAEGKVAAFMKSQSEGAKKVLGNMSAGSDSALMQMCLKGWYDYYQEKAQAAAFQDALGGANSKLAGFSSRNKDSAMSAMQRLKEATTEQEILVVWMPWKKIAKLERIRRNGKEKNERRKKQLNGVKGLFKNFATELEQSIKEGTPRESSTGTPGKKGKSRAVGSPQVPASPEMNP
eukprot:gnl/TRDRNA2_/TRDRNA2_183279_c0_seq1.p1 gnl/TRDRNA2_/TRDRNA2_183279_c0~~gnl/TRDRNA2_/TRDRNA2_183279_c0_seq1.p1  ORF type:complete len:543 (-),score=152.58 gnl/TRDRNA2_/TRDRNA2_183279_c0_seq1:128-1756(-)